MKKDFAKFCYRILHHKSKKVRKRNIGIIKKMAKREDNKYVKKMLGWYLIHLKLFEMTKRQRFTEWGSSLRALLEINLRYGIFNMVIIK